MKRKGNLYEEICKDSAIIIAIHQAAEHKKRRRSVNKVFANIAQYTDKLKEMLVNRTFKATPPKIMTRYDVNDHKERKIQVVPFFPDGVVHRLIVNAIRPIIEKGFYQFSCGSIPNRGGHYAKRYLENAVQNDTKNTRYCLYFDIRKFFDSVERDFTMSSLRQKIKDEKLLALVENILPAKGLPIGYYLSQWLSNFVLTQMDNLVLRHHTLRRDKRNQTAKYYARYIDDCVVLGNNKKALHDLRKKIHEWLIANGLDMKRTWQVYPVDKRAINFVGFLIYRKTTKMRKRNLYKLTRSAKKYRKKPATFVCRYSYVKHTDSLLLRNCFARLFDKARKIIGINAKASLRPA